ncbi:MAG: hypothetical protein GY930_07670 [bacterium]|nr:hypothetical protein [bacterium]
MSSKQNDIRELLQPFIYSLKDPGAFTKQSLFGGREALKQVFDCMGSPNRKSQARAFWSIQALMGGLIRKGHVDQNTALAAIGELLESLVDWVEATPGEEFALSTKDTPQAMKYLKLTPPPPCGDGPLANAETPLHATIENSLGQLLIRSGKLSTAQLSRALDLQSLNGRRLGEVLIAMEAVGIQTLEEALTRQKLLSECQPTLPADGSRLRLRMDPQP